MEWMKHGWNTSSVVVVFIYTYEYTIFKYTCIFTYNSGLRVGSLYGHPSWKAVGFNGQTLLQVQRNGLIKYGGWSPWLGTMWSLQRPSSESKPLAMKSHSLSTWTVIVWSFQMSSWSPKEEGASQFIPCPKQPLQCNGQDLVNVCFSIWFQKNRRPLDHSLGFHSHLTQIFFKSLSPW